jgi:potassium efflux system protein
MRIFLYEISGWLGYLSRPHLLGRGHRLEFLGSLGLLLGLRLNAIVLGWVGVPNGLAHYAAQLFSLWILLALVRLLARRWFPSEAIERLYRQLVQPLFATGGGGGAGEPAG